MKKLIFLATLLLAGTVHAQTYNWAINVGDNSEDVGCGIAVDLTGSGDVYVTGYFVDTVDFDPSGNTAILISNGLQDIFIAKYDDNGNYLWAFNIGDSTSDMGYAIATDPFGNVYLTGYFRNTADFDPSANTANLTSNGMGDIFVAKYDANGNYLWAFNIGDSTNAIGYGIVTDSSGNLYLTGYFRNTADFDPSGNIANLISNGNKDIFVAKYDTGGNYLWAINVGSGEDDEGKSVVIDTAGSGDVYVTGFFSDTADFDPSVNTANLNSNGGVDFFIAKYDANGNYLWAFNVGGTNSDTGHDITIGPAGSGDIYVTGQFGGTVDFDPSVNTNNLTSNAPWDIFVAKYDAASNYLWAFNVGGTNSNIGYGIATDPDGNGDVYVTGFFSGTADFDPSGNTANVTSNGQIDIFISKYDANGNYLSAFNIGGTIVAEGRDISANTSGNVYVTGYFFDTADFDPSGNTVNLTSNGWSDIFIAKYDSSTSVGMNPIVISESLMVYPNPTTGQFTIQGATAEIQIFDLFGRLLLRSNKAQIDMSSYPKGLYVWRVGEARGKLVIE